MQNQPYLYDTGFNPDIPQISQLQQQLQQVHKRPADSGDQADHAKRIRIDQDLNFMHQMQMMQGQHQFAPTPAPFPLPQQQSQFNNLIGSFPSSSSYPVFPNYSPMQQLQQLQPFPATSTPVRGTAGPSFAFPAASPLFPTPPSDGETSSLLSFRGLSTTPARPQNPLLNVEDGVVFKEVPSVLSIDGCAKVKITVGEMKRRMGEPECHDVHQLARLTRHPKSSMRDFYKSFKARGFPLAVNDGKPKADGILSSLIEEEALHLARDFTKLLSAELSLPDLAVIVVNRVAPAGHADSPQYLSALCQHLPAIKEHFSCVKAFLLSAGRDPPELDRMERAGSAIDPALKQFSLKTHGFGPAAASAVLDTMIGLMDHIARCCPTPQQITAATSPLPSHFVHAPVSYNHSFNNSFNSSFNDSGLGASFHSPAASPVSKKAAPSPDVDPALLVAYSQEHVVWAEVAPRIAFDADKLKERSIFVTLGELRRRALGPEKFIVSLMNSYLRRGKKTNTHPELREKLEQRGITMKAIKGIKPSSWSSLCEAEAIALAEATAACLQKLPASQAMKQSVAANRDAAAWIKFIVPPIQQALLNVGTNPAQSRVETHVDLQILRFALITHHFGHSFFASVLSWLHTVTNID